MIGTIHFIKFVMWVPGACTSYFTQWDSKWPNGGLKLIRKEEQRKIIRNFVIKERLQKNYE